MVKNVNNREVNREYTVQEQTVKLIDLGFKKAEASKRYWQEDTFVINNNYCIGELMLMLPKVLHNGGKNYHFMMTHDGTNYNIIYNNIDDAWQLFRVDEPELIDAIFNMLVMLKENCAI